jgi:hypothetical protein
MYKIIKKIKKTYLDFIIALLRYHVMMYQVEVGNWFIKDNSKNILKLALELQHQLFVFNDSLRLDFDIVNYDEIRCKIFLEDGEMQIPQELYFINHLISFKTIDFLNIENTKDAFKKAVESNIYREVKKDNIRNIVGEKKYHELRTKVNFKNLVKGKYLTLLGIIILFTDDILRKNMNKIVNLETKKFLISNKEEIEEKFSDDIVNITQKKLIEVALNCLKYTPEKINVNNILKDLNPDDRKYIWKILEEIYLR